MILSGVAAKPVEPASKVMLQNEGRGMFNQDLAESGKLAVLWKDNVRGHLEAQLPPPGYSCLLIAVLLRKDTELGEIL